MAFRSGSSTATVLATNDSGVLIAYATPVTICPSAAGVNEPRFEAHFTPAVEVGWRLARHGWRQGYATEAARAAVAYGFGELVRDEIVSFTFAGNERSRGVMERLGMTHDPADDFPHPLLPADDPLRQHVLYRLKS